MAVGGAGDGPLFLMVREAAFLLNLTWYLDLCMFTVCLAVGGAGDGPLFLIVLFDDAA